MRITLSLVISFVALFSGAASAYSPKELEAIRMIKADFIPFTKTLSRSIKTYHWNNLNDVTKTLGTTIHAEEVSLKSPEIIRFANKWKDSFWLEKETNGDIGWGLYTSNTPTASSAWRCEDWLAESGCSDWIMAEITLAEGSKFLDLRWGPPTTHNTLKLSKKATDYMSLQLGCAFYGTSIADLEKNGVMYGSYRKGKLSANPCFPLIAEALKQSQIAFVTYKWFDEIPTGCDLPKSKMGFVLVNAPVNAETLTVISSKNNIPASEEAEYARLTSYISKLGNPEIVQSMLTKSKATGSLPDFFYCQQKSSRSEDMPL